jgi:hypothetical protein
MVQQAAVLIGVDGGATEIKAHAVGCDDLRRPTSFVLRTECAARVYPRSAEFAPVPVAEQLAQRQSGRYEISGAEQQQGRLWLQAAAEAICDVVRQCGGGRVLVGIGMPGLKTEDGRGICVINNGPRIPDYLGELERRLAAGGVELAAPIAALGSDADYCGLGEEYAAEGLFRDVRSAYYVGCGTGIADAMKLDGRLVAFDQARSWILKSWQIPSASGPVFEQLVSAASLNRVYSALAGDASPAEYPERAAVAGEPRAKVWMADAALILAELIFERLWTVKNGRPQTPQRGEAYVKLNPQHEFRGSILERVVVGQRLGLIYADSAYEDVFGCKLERALGAFIAECGDAELERACLARAAAGDDRAGQAHEPKLRTGFLMPSRLRAAPALGAAVAAVRALIGLGSD